MVKHLTHLKILAVFFLIALFSISAFVIISSMKVDDKGTASNCPLRQVSTCQMSISEHVTQWQQMFLAIFDTNTFIVFLALFSFVLFSTIKYVGIDAPLLHFYKLYIKDNFKFKLFDYLLLAISRGIIHPKIYA